MRHASTIALVALCLFGCGGAGPEANGPAPQSNVETQGGQTTKLQLSSAAFEDGGAIPAQYTCDGRNVSPPLAWSGAPAATRTFALIADDPDAPRGTWTHWLLYNLPAGVNTLPENVPPHDETAEGARHGTNDFRQRGYGGPCPPSGTHRYFFKLYALDAELPLQPGAARDELLAAMRGHVLAEGQLMGRYQRR